MKQPGITYHDGVAWSCCVECRRHTGIDRDGSTVHPRLEHFMLPDCTTAQAGRLCAHLRDVIDRAGAVAFAGTDNGRKR